MAINKFVFALGFLFLFSQSACAAIPPPPSQEELNRLRELGRQNELKYGSGGTVRVVTKLKPSLTPTPTLTPTVGVTGVPTVVTPVSKDSKEDFYFYKLWSRIIAWFKQRFNQEIQVGDPLKVMPSEAPTPTIAPTAKPTKVPATAQELWQKGFNIWVNSKDYAKASVYYQQALQVNPNHVPTLASYGYILGAFYNKFAEGEAMLKKAMSLDSSWAYAPYNLGLLYDISGKREEGIYWLQYTVDHFPDHPDIEWFKDHLRVAKEWQY